MTILEAITRADLIRPNELDPAVKLRWLSTLDGQIHAELLAAHEGGPESFRGYDGETELRTTELLVPHPYDELYLRYLLMRIDLEHGELDRYNNDAAAFNRLWQSYAGTYNRTHKPKGTARLCF
jgi:hypothetical protein